MENLGLVQWMGGMWGRGSGGGVGGGFELGVETSGRTLDSPRGSTLPHSQGGN
jgi:hypothetical protein